MNILQDAHIHLQDSGAETEKILSAAKARRVGRFFCNGTSADDWPDVKSLAESHDEVIPFFGVHPWFADSTRSGWEDLLVKYLSLPGACVGEIGLDKSKTSVDFETQRRVFRRQLDIAVELNKPFAVHCVQAWDVLTEEIAARKYEDLRFMVHWFSGSPELAAGLIKLGAYISFSPRLLYERALKHRASFAATPADKILLETDYPYLPDAVEGQIEVAEKYFEWLGSLYGIASRLKNMDQEEFEQKVWGNGTVFLH